MPCPCLSSKEKSDNKTTKDTKKDTKKETKPKLDSGEDTMGKDAKVQLKELQEENASLKKQIKDLELENQRLAQDKETAIKTLRTELDNMNITMATYVGDHALHRRLSQELIEGDEKDDITAENIDTLRESGMRHAVVNDGAVSWLGSEAEKPKKHPKEFKTRQHLMTALRNNGMLGRLENARLAEIVEYLSPEKYTEGDVIFKEGEEGHNAYIIESGEVAVTKGGKDFGIVRKGHCFGEVTLFFKVDRQATVTAKTDCVLWTLSRASYNIIMEMFGKDRLNEIRGFLKGIQLFSNLEDKVIARLANGVVLEYYQQGDVIVRENEMIDSMDILDIGEIELSQADESGRSKAVKLLKKGDFFGEHALGNEFKSKYTATAKTDVQVLAIDRDNCQKLTQHLTPELGTSIRKSDSGNLYNEIMENVKEFSKIKLNDLSKTSVLGQGSFGIVHLCNSRGAQGRQWFALKGMSKLWIKQNHAYEHVIAEKRAWSALVGSPFLCQLYATMKDYKHLYYLMEILPGGDLFTHISKRGYLGFGETQFFTACIVLGLEYMHKRNIIYRDLKPENIALDQNGYAKLIDFGFAKDISGSFRTFTFCGSPYYMAPEVVSSEGHDFGCDLWSLGVTCIETNTGQVPFRVVHNEHVLFRKITRGFEGFDLPRNLHHKVRQLVQALCQKRPADRLGYDDGGTRDIRQHKFFDGFEWKALATKKMLAPIQPNVSGPEDTTYARPPDKKYKEPPDDTGDWDKEF